MRHAGGGADTLRRRCAFRRSQCLSLLHFCCDVAPARSSLGDGKWLLLLVLVTLPGLYAVSVDSDTDLGQLAPSGCYSLYWLDAFVVAALAVIIFVHVLIWQFPRPVSAVDNSPLSTTVAAIVVVGPPVFVCWSGYLLFASDVRNQCDYDRHTAVWNYFAAIVAVEAMAGVALLVAAVQIVISIVQKPGQPHTAAASERPLDASHSSPSCSVSSLCSSLAVGPVDGSKTSAGTFTSDPSAHLDNGRWLTMEARRIKSERQD